MTEQQSDPRPLSREIVRIVNERGDIHREDLAEQLGLPVSSPLLRAAIFRAYRYKKVDFCWQYIVKWPERREAGA